MTLHTVLFISITNHFVNFQRRVGTAHCCYYYMPMDTTMNNILYDAHSVWHTLTLMK